MLADLFDRIRANGSAARDGQAEAFINDAVRTAPYAPYVLAQTVLVQQQALEGAARHISELEAQTRASSPAPAQETSFLGSLGRSLFGGSPAPAPAPQPQRSSGYDASAYQRGGPQSPPYAPPPQAYAAPPQAGPWGAAAAAPQGGGFLSGALRTAAGVAGGVVLGNALEGMLGGHGGGGLFGGGSGLMGGAGLGRGETVNNFYEAAPDSAGQHAEDVLQDQDQDQDDAQDAADNSGYDSGSSDSGGWDT